MGEIHDVVLTGENEIVGVNATGGHTIGGLCGFGGTHSVGDIALATEGVEKSES